MKKILLSILCLSVILAAFILLPTEASAATDGYYTYEISNGEATITGVDTSISGDITIPSTLGGYPVTTIGDSAFFGCSSLESITIPDSVTSIGNSAFFHCSSLTSITIPDSITSIGNSAFASCSSLESITIPNSVTTIGSSAFFDCDALVYNLYDNGRYLGNEENPYVVLVNVSDTSITSCQIHPDTRLIHSGAFSYCQSLTNVTIPNSVTSLGDSAFFGCDALAYNTYDNGRYLGNEENPYVLLVNVSDTSITSCQIHPNTRFIHSDAFMGCDNLTSIAIPDSVTSIGGHAFRLCYSLTSVAIPDGVTHISSGLFSDCENLTSVTIPDTATTIGDSAFSGCINLTEISIPNSVTSIGEYAFHYTGLNSVTIPSGVTSIGYAMFYQCFELSSIVIPDSVTSISDFAFSSCYSLETVYYRGNEAQWNAIEMGYDNEYLTDAGIIYNYRTTDLGGVDTWNLILKEDIGVNFQMVFADEIKTDTNAFVEIRIDGKVTKIPVSDALNGLQVNVAAAQMTDSIAICVVAGDGSRSESAIYCVKSYADYILAGDYDDATKTLVKEMLNYGAMAQEYFDHGVDNLANSGITGAGATEVPGSAQELQLTDNISGLNFYGASLIFRDRIAVRYYFTGSADDLIFTANGKTYTPVAKDGMYYIEIADILPQDLEQQITLTVADASGKTLSVSYSPMNYIVRMNQKGSAELKALVKALYNYHLAAKVLA